MLGPAPSSLGGAPHAPDGLGLRSPALESRGPAFALEAWEGRHLVQGDGGLVAPGGCEEDRVGGECAVSSLCCRFHSIRDQTQGLTPARRLPHHWPAFPVSDSYASFLERNFYFKREKRMCSGESPHKVQERDLHAPGRYSGDPRATVPGRLLGMCARVQCLARETLGGWVRFPALPAPGAPLCGTGGPSSIGSDLWTP